VETWMLRSRAEVKLPGGAAIVSATLDPHHLIPDKDRSNNRWPAGHEQASSAMFTNGSGVSN
jgi:hypothetical protein